MKYLLLTGNYSLSVALHPLSSCTNNNIVLSRESAGKTDSTGHTTIYVNPTQICVRDACSYLDYLFLDPTKSAQNHADIVREGMQFKAINDRHERLIMLTNFRNILFLQPYNDL